MSTPQLTALSTFRNLVSSCELRSAVKEFLQVPRYSGRSETIAFLCTDTAIDFIAIPVLWDLFRRVIVVRSNRWRDCLALHDAGWSVIADARVPLGLPAPQRRLFGDIVFAKGDDQCCGGSEHSISLATSGSTGPPKYVRLPKESIVENAKASVLSIDGYERSTVVPCLSLGSSYGFSKQLISPLIAEARVRCDGVGKVSNPFFDCGHVSNRMTVVLSPVQLRAYVSNLESDLSARNWTVVCGGDYLHADTIERTFRQLRELRIAHTYGLTELGPRVSTNILIAPPDESGAGVVGFPIAGAETRVKKDKGVSLIEVRTPYGGLAYEDGTKIRQHYTDWVTTGDEGEMASDGRLRVFGRASSRSFSQRSLRLVENMVLGRFDVLSCRASIGVSSIDLDVRPGPGLSRRVKLKQADIVSAAREAGIDDRREINVSITASSHG